jgi:N utilization substance protein A
VRDVSEEVGVIQLGEELFSFTSRNLISKIHEHDNTNLYKQFKDLIGELLLKYIMYVQSCNFDG